MLDVAKNNPVLKAETEVHNNDFITVDGVLYLISNTVTGDNAYVDAVAIPAGEFLNGFVVEAWAGQKLVIDEKHIAYAESKDYDDLFPAEGDAVVLTVNAAGKLAVASAAPSAGVYFVVTDKTHLTEKAIKAKVMVATATAGE